jgi:phosphoglycerol transferase MdoB-like AlkP superfamily enzyme
MVRLPRLIKWTASVVFVLLVILTIFRLVFFLWYRPPGYVLPGSAFLMGLRLDLRVVSILGLFMLLLSAIPFFNPFRNRSTGRWWNIFLSFVFLLILFFYVVDFFHYDYLKQRLNANILNYLQDAGISMGMVWETYPVIPGIIFMALLVVLVYVFFKKLLSFFLRRNPLPQKRIWIRHVLFGLILFAGVWGSLGQFPLRWSDVFSLKDAFRAQLALNPVQMFFSTLSFKNSTYNEAKARSYYNLMADYLSVPARDSAALNYQRTLYPSGPIDPSTSPNVILVICESFSSYKSSMWNPLNPSPYFDSLSAQGIFFDHCFTPSYGTARGIWATITGIPDVEAPRTASRNPSLVDQQTILNDFRSYEKYYFIGGSASWANMRGLLEFNIEGLKLYEQEDFKSERVDVWGVSDKNLFLESSKILAAQQKPFFAIIQTADNHRPYTIPDADLSEFKKQQLPVDSLKKYGFISIEEFNAVRYMDFSIRKFMEAASREAYFKNTVFVFIGDHGIRGDAGTMFPKAWTEQGLTTVHVPLLFYSPLLENGKRHQVCSQLDIMPSIAGLLSVPYTNTSLGKNLFDPALMGNDFKSSSAFIADPDDHEKKIGMIAGDYFFRQSLGKNDYELVSIRNNQPLPEGRFKDSVKNKLQLYSNAFYETARYMLYHNKKAGSAQ